MSVYSIYDFIKAGKDALENDNIWAAFSVALMLPSICSRMEFADKKLGDHKSYVEFCKKIFRESVTLDSSGKLCTSDTFSPWFVDVLGKDFAEVLYAMRCGIVHEGLIDISVNGKQLFLDTGSRSSSIESRNYLIVSVKDICKNIFTYIELWASVRNTTALKYGIAIESE